MSLTSESARHQHQQRRSHLTVAEAHKNFTQRRKDIVKPQSSGFFAVFASFFAPLRETICGAAGDFHLPISRVIHSPPCAPVAQRLEQQTHNLLVRGSNPCGGTNRINLLEFTDLPKFIFGS